ncbi:DUF262 domain-containing protein [Lysobacter capsici]|uniref:DUF262 domain-containing protein n=1 Tax=Lysobacter capsici TaxID=435897 RepID=UPI000BBAD5C0|nr:DUF262 domain-containing protein [Lysobacter capsici]ATE72418.1 hypothetical protein CNO08_14280 [Lysobacter capsici]
MHHNPAPPISIDEEELLLLEQDDEAELPPSDIVAYSELRSCADLYRMYEEGFLELQPDFQREEVWPRTAKTRFIDSLVKQLPIPSLCFAYDYKTEKRQVIDGLQRVTALVRFLGPECWQLARLEDVDPRISGVSNEDFRKNGSELAAFYRRVQNATLPITVLRCDFSKKTHQSYLFTIFHRLNTGGMKLNNQEIRNCIYHGSFNLLLRHLAVEVGFQRLLGFSVADIKRFKVEEMLLRFFAFYDRIDEYKGRLATFLNSYMSDHKDIQAEEVARKRDLALDLLQCIGEKLPELFEGKRRTLAVVEALLVGVARNMETVKASPPARVSDAFKRMLADEEFSEDKLRGGLANSERVKGRIDAATVAFRI